MRWQKWGIGLAIAIGIVVVIGVIAGRDDEPPYKATPGPDIVKYTVRREWNIPAGGWGAELAVDDSAIRDDVLRLGRWLLDKTPDGKTVSFQLYNSREEVAHVTNISLDKKGVVTWLADLPPLPKPDMPFDELKTFAMTLEYEELYRNMETYSIITWRKTGGPPPLIYFRGEVIQAIPLEGILKGIWSAELALMDRNSIVFNYKKPVLMAGDRVEVVVVCEELRSVSMRDGSTRTVPFCIAWQVKPR